MKNKLNVFSGVFCAVVVLACLICYSGYVSQLYFDVCTPYAYSPIAGCEGIRLDGMPEGYLIPDYMAVDDPEEMEVVEITYDLVGTINDTTDICGNICLYYGENDEWISVLEKDEDYWGPGNYQNCNILPPGEHAVFKEYVLVPKGMKEIRAYRVSGGDEGITIQLR